MVFIEVHITSPNNSYNQRVILQHFHYLKQWKWTILWTMLIFVDDLSTDTHLPPRHLAWVVYTIDDGEFTFTLIFLYVRRCQKCTLYERNGIYFISEFKMAVFHFLRFSQVVFTHWNYNGVTFFFSSLLLQIGAWLRMINVRFIESNKKKTSFFCFKKKPPISLWLISSTGIYIYIRIVIAILILLSLITFTIIPSMNWM